MTSDEILAGLRRQTIPPTVRICRVGETEWQDVNLVPNFAEDVASCSSEHEPSAQMARGTAAYDGSAGDLRRTFAQGLAPDTQAKNLNKNARLSMVVGVASLTSRRPDSLLLHEPDHIRGRHAAIPEDAWIPSTVDKHWAERRAEQPLGFEHAPLAQAEPGEMRRQ
jgi:hypothetical protein